MTGALALAFGLKESDEQSMNTLEFYFRSETLHALSTGALYWPSKELLVVSDLHLGKSARAARFGGAQLPPYETTETLTRLGQAQKQTLHCSGLPRFDGVVPFGMERIAGYVEASHIGI